MRTGLRITMAALILALASPMAAPAAFAQGAISESDRRQGQQAHQQIVQQFGGEVKGPLADYVRRVGLKVALPSVPGSTAGDWTITVLDSPVPNAMAIPGGYLYITRGLLGMINSEAELASVLGHEAGHVAGRHSDKRQGRAVIGALGSILAGAVFGDTVGQVANLGSSAMVQGYSRSQEHDADSRGLRYSVAAGYDPRAAADMLAALDRVATVEGRAQMEQGGLQSLFASHPVTRERIQRVRNEASRLPAGGHIGREAYLAAIDGMAYGDSAAQGIVSGPSFRHAGLRLGFDAPPGFTLQNSPQVVAGQARDGARFTFQLAPLRQGQTLEQLVDSAWRQLVQNQYPQIQYQQRRINQLDAALSEAQVQSGRSAVRVGVHAYRLDNDRAAVLVTQGPANQSQRFEPLISSFRRLNTQEVAEAGRGRRVQVVTVRAGETAATLAQRMAAPYNRVESLLALNGMEAGDIRAGARVKLITG